MLFTFPIIFYHQVGASQALGIQVDLVTFLCFLKQTIRPKKASAVKVLSISLRVDIVLSQFRIGKD